MTAKKLDLPELGERLRLTDMGIIMLLARRMVLARQVEETKRKDAQPISRPEVERARLEAARVWAERFGLDPDFAAGIMYEAIGESCKVQMIQLQDSQGFYPPPESEEDRRAHLKQNLIAFTDLCAASYDEQYAASFLATRTHAEFEEGIVRQLAEEMAGGLALDLGCATGQQALTMAPFFERVVGYDISPAMIREAQGKHLLTGENVFFSVHDLEAGIPAEDGSASLVVMTMGTASDIPDLSELLREIRRVLKSGGKAFLSFYNREALLYQWGFMPWTTGLAATINMDRQCLDVTWEEGGTERHYSLFAQPVSPGELEGLLPAGLPMISFETHPVVASALPSFLLEGAGVGVSVDEIDRRLAVEGDERGAYLSIVVRKT